MDNLTPLQQLNNVINNPDLIAKHYEVGDLNNFNIRHEQRDAMTQLMLNNVSIIESISSENLTLVYKGEIIFIGGVANIWNGVGEGWLLIGANFPKIFKKLPRSFIKGFRFYFDAMPHVRIQTTVVKDFTIGMSFLKFFGFKNEGLMEHFGPDGKDYYRMSLVRKDKLSKVGVL